MADSMCCCCCMLQPNPVISRRPQPCSARQGVLLVCPGLPGLQHLLDVADGRLWMGADRDHAQSCGVQHAVGNRCCRQFRELRELARGVQLDALLVDSGSNLHQAQLFHVGASIDRSIASSGRGRQQWTHSRIRRYKERRSESSGIRTYP